MADEPFKLELIDLAGGPGSGAHAAEGASAEIGAGELTIYDTNRWFSRTMRSISFLMALRSSGVKGSSTPKS
jgi:hypothetical protein